MGYAQYWRNWWLTQPVSFRPEHLEMRKRSVREIRRINRAGERPTEPPPSAHQIHDYLHLAAALGANPAPLPPLLRVTASEIAQAQATLLQALTLRTNVPPDLSLPLLGLNPGAEYGPAKRWPLENFIAAARQISRRLGPCHWLVFGGLQDWRVCHQITQSMGGSAVNLAGRTSLREFMGLLSLCRVLLTNDTGPMHVAAALGTPVVVPFGSTSSALTGPGLPGNPLHHLLAASAACAPCFRRACPIDFRCMTRLGTHRVVEAVLTAASGRR